MLEIKGSRQVATQSWPQDSQHKMNLALENPPTMARPLIPYLLQQVVGAALPLTQPHFLTKILLDDQIPAQILTNYYK